MSGVLGMVEQKNCQGCDQQLQRALAPFPTGAVLSVFTPFPLVLFEQPFFRAQTTSYDQTVGPSKRAALVADARVSLRLFASLAVLVD